MRVIAGIARSLPLKTPLGDKTRPTTDRIKETLFNMLQTYITDAVFIDFFCGSGGIGIEAISRGASRAYFIENDKEAKKLLIIIGAEKTVEFMIKNVDSKVRNTGLKYKLINM